MKVRKQKVASRHDRALAEAVARFIVENLEPGEHISPMVALICISRRFPGIALRTALCGFVFRDLLYQRVLQ
jgi:hypothetical protein